MLFRARSALVLVAVLATLPLPADAQYFGRNKVQYDRLDFRVLDTPHYQIHFYPEAATAIEDAARMAERWYERMARLFEHELIERRPLILYADHPDFQQTNVLTGRIGEGTGGVTEGLRDRIVMPLGSSYGDTDHVLGHEIVHSFQFDMARGARGGGLPGLMQLPLWFVEGMAEYFSLGREHSLTAMWMRDALLRGEFPTLGEMTRDQFRYFPYRFGHAFWAYVGGAHGDAAVSQMMRIAPQVGVAQSVREVLGISTDTLSARWQATVEAHFAPLMEGRTPPGEAGTLLISPATGGGTQNVAPSLSPDGRYLAFLSERDLFSTELYLADAQTGEIIRSLTSSVRDAHFDAIRFLDSSGAWTPDGEEIAVVVFAEGRNRIQLYRARDGSRGARIDVPAHIGELRGPAFSPDGRRIVFSGQSGGITNLFMVELETREVTQLTDDRHTALQPTFSPDGQTVAFVTDLGPATDFGRLTFGPRAIAILDLGSGSIERLAPLGDADHWNPQFTPDGQGLFFLADPDGFRDIYRVSLGDGQIWQVTDLATGVSGITHSTPAITVARETGTVAFSVFDGAEFHVYALDAVATQGSPVTSTQVSAEGGRILAPAPPPEGDRVDRLLADPEVGLRPVGAYDTADARPFDRGLGLTAIGQPTVGVGVDQFGTAVGGSISALFSDLLGDRNLFVGVQAQGELQDVGGQVFYQDLAGRWNWGVGALHFPIRYFRTGRIANPEVGQIGIVRQDERTFISQATTQLMYPFSTIRRVEFGLGYTRYGFSLRQDSFYYDGLGRLVGHERVDLPADDPIHLGEASVALVEDNSFFGFTSPVRGWRGRYEVSQTVGTLGFTGVILDHRRYFAPLQELTLAFRGLHLGRYGLSGEGQGRLRPIYLGQESLVRGYAARSFDVLECTPTPEGQCAEFERLFGHRIGVLSAEARLAFLGTDRFGLIPFPWLPTELLAFADAGLAWNDWDETELAWETDSAARVPVVSTGVGARMNLMGALILEIYYAVPWQRPDKGGHFGLHIAPGW